MTIFERRKAAIDVWPLQYPMACQRTSNSRLVIPAYCSQPVKRNLDWAEKGIFKKPFLADLNELFHSNDRSYRWTSKQRWISKFETSAMLAPTTSFNLNEGQLCAIASESRPRSTGDRNFLRFECLADIIYLPNLYLAAGPNDATHGCTGMQKLIKWNSSSETFFPMSSTRVCSLCHTVSSRAPSWSDDIWMSNGRVRRRRTSESF